MKAPICTLGRRHRLRTRLRVFCRNERAAAMIEFAMVSLPLFGLLIAILETALVFFAQQAVETTGEAAARLIITGQAQLGGWSASQFKTQVCQSLPPVLGCKNLMIDVQTASSFSSVSAGSPTMTYDANGKPVWQFNPGSAGSIVIVRVMYLWPVATGPLGFDLSNQSDNHRLLISTSVGQTEPYNS